MADQPKARATKTSKAADDLAARMAGTLAPPPADTKPAARKSRAAAPPRQPQPGQAASSRPAAPPRRAAGMPAEQPRPASFYPARISHTTTPAQLQELEAIRSAEKATGNGAVSVTALLRAAVDLCLQDQRLRARWVKLARTEWR
jgi:hypothetical protein